MRYLPNIISIARIILVIPTLYYLWQHEYSLALLLFLLAGISDGLDGYLARRFAWQTRLGTYLDPIGDKLLLVGCYWVLGMLDHVPMWLVYLVIGRDVLIVFGATMYHLAVAGAKMQPLLISKINTVVQILLVLAVLYRVSALPFADLIPDWLLQGILGTVVVTTVWSGLAYIVGWGRRIITAIQTSSVHDRFQ